MWDSLKKVLPNPKSTSTIIQNIEYKNKKYTKVHDIVEIFNKYFVTIGQKLAQAFGRNGSEQNESLSLKTDASFSLSNVSTEFVLKSLKLLKVNKAIGLDKISIKMLKDGVEIIAPVLQKLINFSIKTGQFPKNWKSEKVVALFKNSGDSNKCDNYRPISILPTVSKILNVQCIASCMII